MDIEKYRKYTPVDFLKDDNFLKWLLFREERDDEWWNNFIEQYPDLRSKIEEAVALFNDNIRFSDHKLTELEVSECLTSLQDSIREKRQRKTQKSFVLQTLAIAACIIAIVILVPFFINKEDIQQNDMTTFIQTLPEPDFTATTTKLILSDSSTVSLSNKESSIQYDKEAIKADGNLILKEKAAVYNQLIIPYGKRSVLTFSDGTKAWVNAGSKLVYPTEFSKDKREIYVDGEVYIEVFEDTKRPFVVNTQDMRVKVLGTKFNVSAYKIDKEKSVVLLSGSVNVSSKKYNSELTLTPNQKYLVQEDSYKVKTVDAENYTSWTKGLYIFESEELKNILIRLERYYGVRIKCDDTIEDLKCSGKLDLKEDLNKLLTELARALSTEYKKETDGSYIMKIKL